MSQCGGLALADFGRDSRSSDSLRGIVFTMNAKIAHKISRSCPTNHHFTRWICARRDAACCQITLITCYYYYYYLAALQRYLVISAYCNIRSSVVGQSVCLLVTFMSPAKKAEPIEMPFGGLTQVGPGKHVGPIRWVPKSDESIRRFEG